MTAVFVAVVVLWAIFLRPQFLGGPAQLVLVSGTSMEPHMRGGDLVLVTRARTYRVGDRVAYRIPRGDPAAGRVVIHRIVGGSATAGFVMRGDNRTTNDRWRPKPGDVVGAARLRIPLVGRVALMVLTPVGLGLLAGLAVFAFIALGPDRQRPTRAAEPAAATPGCVSQPPPGVPAPVPAASPITVGECLRRTSANLRAAGAAARARRLQRPDEPQTTGALLTEFAAGVQHAASRWRDREP